MQISHSVVKPNYIMTLLKLLDETYSNAIYKDNSWPENAKKEFVAALHRFMA